MGNENNIVNDGECSSPWKENLYAYRRTPQMIRTAIKILFRKLGHEVHRVPKKTVLSQVGVLEEEQGDDFTRLRSEFRKHATIKLHFGSGPRILKGWVNIDLEYVSWENYLKYYGDQYYPQEIRGDKSDLYIFDVTKCGLPLPDNCVDVVFHEDFLEHLNQRDQVIFLAEVLRVLKKGDIHRISTPSLITSMRDHSDFSQGYDGVYTDEWNKHRHLNVLTPNLLEELALMVGYSKVVFTGRDQSNSKLVPFEYRPDPNDRPEYGNIFADLVK